MGLFDNFREKNGGKRRSSSGELPERRTYTGADGKPMQIRHPRSFADVEDGMYYSDAVCWADGSGIVTGDGSGAFAPGRDITREELAVILHRYAQHKGYGASERTDLSAYADAGAISPYAVQAMTWANAVGLITGDGNGGLNPGGSASRSEVAAILQRFIAAVAN